jgi:hypothetical protein
MEGSRAKALVWTLRVIASDVKRSRRILLCIATAAVLNYTAIAFECFRKARSGFPIKAHDKTKA